MPAKPFVTLFLVGLAFAMGCGGPKGIAVSGTVSWQGQPLTEGDIIFAPVAENEIPVAAKIAEGRYRMHVKEGKWRVQIYATRETAQVDEVMGVAPREQFIPSRYNDETELTADVTTNGDKHFDFALPDGGS